VKPGRDHNDGLSEIGRASNPTRWTVVGVAVTVGLKTPPFLVAHDMHACSLVKATGAPVVV